MCLFICFSSKALHVELVSDLISEAFLTALHRFVSRRGKRQNNFSDNGETYVSANKKLQSLHQLVINSQNIMEISGNEGIQWHFIHAFAPHYGGLWTAGMKKVKYPFKRVLGETLTFEEIYAIITQIEAVVNSSPLQRLTEAEDDLYALTPANFFIGKTLTEPSI